MQFLVTITSQEENTLLTNIALKVDEIMANQQQLAEELGVIKTAVEKIGAETEVTQQKIADLEQAVIAAGQSSPEVDAALQALKEQVQKVDDMVADAPTGGGDTPPAGGDDTPPVGGGDTPPVGGDDTPPVEGGDPSNAPDAPAEPDAPRTMRGSRSIDR